MKTSILLSFCLFWFGLTAFAADALVTTEMAVGPSVVPAEAPKSPVVVAAPAPEEPAAADGKAKVEAEKPAAPTVQDSVKKLKASMKVTTVAVEKLDKAAAAIKTLQSDKAFQIKKAQVANKKQDTEMIDGMILDAKEDLVDQVLELKKQRKQSLDDLQELSKVQAEAEKNSLWNRFSAGVGFLRPFNIPEGKQIVSGFVQEQVSDTQDKITFKKVGVTTPPLAVADIELGYRLSLVLATNPITVINKGANITELGIGIGWAIDKERDYILSFGDYVQTEAELVDTGKNSGALVDQGAPVMITGAVHSYFLTVSSTF